MTGNAASTWLQLDISPYYYHLFQFSYCNLLGHNFMSVFVLTSGVMYSTWVQLHIST